MNDSHVERRIRDVLERNAPVWPRPMPPGTARRVRARQGVTALAAVGVAIALVLASIGLVSALPGHLTRPADRQTEHPPTAGHPPQPPGHRARQRRHASPTRRVRLG
jgi:hypothetical protein